MKLPLFVLAAIIAAPAAGQAITSQTQPMSPWSTGWQMQAFSEQVRTRDFRTLSIDERRSAAYRVAKAARKARARAEREARRARNG